MARIPESEVERIKSEVSLVRLIEGAGHTLKPQGKDLAMRCPLHEDDDTPSFIVTPAKNVWHCFGCQRGGSVIDWVMATRRVSFRHAVELLAQESPALIAPPTRAVRSAAPAFVPSADDDALLRLVIDAYHATLKQSPEAQAYLAKRGLTHPEVIDHFRLGFANRTLGYRLPGKQVKAGAELRGALQRIGIYRESGHEHFNGSLVIPVFDDAGNVTEVYGRKITPNLRPGTPLHLYLPGPHRGVFNEQGLVGQEEIILCEALIDALTFWCAGYHNVTSSYGIEGFTDEILEAFRRHGTKRVLIAYDRDAPGDAAAAKLAERLMAASLECYRCLFPKGMDANAYALSVQPAAKSLGLVIRQAEWVGKGAGPARSPCEPVTASAETILVHNVIEEASSLVAAAKEEISAPAALPEPPAHRVPPSTPAVPVEIADHELRLTCGDRVYTVRGIDKNLSYEKLSVWIKATCDAHGRANAVGAGCAGAVGAFVHIDTVELYAAKQRAAWIKQASVELGVSEDVAKSDLGTLLRAVEQRQDELIRARLKPAGEKASTPALTPAQSDAGLALLRDPKLIERIVADVEATGVVGEASNALVAYLACVSRKLDKPLAILIQSTSAAGKSTLMDALLALMPEAERVHYSAMTGQSLFYLGEHSMKHKILAIAEEEGVRQAGYALKVLQSQGELTIASTGKDPTTGQLVTQEYRVEGPVMLFLTTTAIDVDEELQNRCIVLTINESREQTRAIQARQRAARTLDGLLAKARSDDVLAAHRAAQQLLRPLAVVNPYAEQLTFAHDRVRLRRDHAKYLALIDSIALLHQHQRPIRAIVHNGKTLEYVEVTQEDIALANRLAHEVLGRSLDELPPPTRRVLQHTVTLVDARAKTQAIERSAVRFTRRELREHAGISHSQLAVHLDRLLALEYVLAHSGRNGQRFVYELVFDGDAASDALHAAGLIDPNVLGTTANLPASDDNLPARFRAASGQLPATFLPLETPLNASADAQPSSLVAALDLKALPGKAKKAASYRNGAAHAAVR
jgi:DNA primase